MTLIAFETNFSPQVINQSLSEHVKDLSIENQFLFPRKCNPSKTSMTSRLAANKERTFCHTTRASQLSNYVSDLRESLGECSM